MSRERNVGQMTSKMVDVFSILVLYGAVRLGLDQYYKLLCNFAVGLLYIHLQALNAELAMLTSFDDSWRSSAVIIY